MLPIPLRVPTLDGPFLGAVVGSSFHVVGNSSITLLAIHTSATPGTAVTTMVLLLRGSPDLWS